MGVARWGRDSAGRNVFMASARPLIVDELEVLKLNVADSNQR